MVPETETAADPIADAARELAAAERAVQPSGESKEGATIDPVTGEVGVETGANEPQVGDPAESPGTEAIEAAVEDGSDKGKDEGDPTGTKALREAVDKDPTLASVPAIRERLGLPPIGDATAMRTPLGGMVVPLNQSDEEFRKQYRATYDEKMKAGDDVGAFEAVAQALADRAEVRAEERTIRRLQRTARDGHLVEVFVEAHQEFKGKEADVYRRLQETRRVADVDRLDDSRVLSLLDPKPSKSDAGKALAQASAEAARKKNAAAALAAGSPTNQRSAGAPAPKRAATVEERAAATVLGNAGADREKRSLYSADVLRRRATA